ncbi:hypothetical protein D3C84_1115190 [compost metagenome]
MCGFDGRDGGQNCRVLKQVVGMLKRLRSRLQPPLHALLALVIDRAGLSVIRQGRRLRGLVDLRQEVSDAMPIGQGQSQAFGR